MAISFSAMSDRIPSQLRKLRRSLRALLNWRWKNDDFASCICFGKIGMKTSFSRANFILSVTARSRDRAYLEVGRMDG